MYEMVRIKQTILCLFVTTDIQSIIYTEQLYKPIDYSKSQCHHTDLHVGWHWSSPNEAVFIEH